MLTSLLAYRRLSSNKQIKVNEVGLGRKSGLEKSYLYGLTGQFAVNPDGLANFY